MLLNMADGTVVSAEPPGLRVAGLASPVDPDGSTFLVDNMGNTLYFTASVVGIDYQLTTTGVALTNGHVPSNFFLEQNYPNPFNPRTVISYQLAVNSIVTLRVYDMLGREVETLVNSGQEAGYHNVAFNGADLPSGVYLYRLQAGSFRETKKLLLLK